MKKIFKFFDYIWPMLEKTDKNMALHRKNTEIKKNKFTKSQLDLALNMYEQQKSRIAIVESKSTIFIGIFGAIITLLVFNLKNILTTVSKTNFDYFLLLCVTILTVYLLRIIYFSIKALTRKSYHVISEATFINRNDRQITEAILTLVKNNYDTVNKKVDMMVMAHEYALRSIIILFFFAFLLIIYSSYCLKTPIFNYIRTVFQYYFQCLF